MEQVQTLQKAYEKFQDPLQDSPLRRAMEQAQKLQEMYQRFQDPFHDSPARRLIKEAQRLQQSYQRFQDPLQDSPARRLMEQGQNLLDSFQNAINAGRAGDLFFGLAETVARLQGPTNALLQAASAGVGKVQVAGATAELHSQSLLIDTLATIEENKPAPELDVEEVANQIIVIRAANLRSGSTTNDQIVAKLYPGDTAELLEADGKWLRVRFYNVQSSTTHEGWIYGALTRKPKA